MTFQEALAHCLAKPGALQDEPWDGDIVVKVGSRIFAFLGAPESDRIGLKCGKDLDEAGTWRLEFPADVGVMPYIGRYGWNTFALDGGYGDEELRGAMDASYDDVVRRLPRAQRPVIGPSPAVTR